MLPHDPGGFPVGKALHVVAYAFLAGYAACLRPAGAWRWVILLFLLEHGVLTEWVQLFVPEAGRGREGHVSSTTAPWRSAWF